MILIVGATGTIGRHAAKQLIARGLPVRVMSRDPERARTLPEFAGASILTGDSAQPESLGAVFEGVDKVLLIPPSGPTWNTQEQNLLEAARHAGVKHIVKISAMGADLSEPSMSLSYHAQGEKRLAESGIPFTVLRGNSFMQNFLVFYAPVIRTDGVVCQCIGDAKMSMVDTRDIAEVATAVLTSDNHLGKTYELTGPEALSYSDAVEKLGAVVGRPVRYQHIEPEAYEQLLIGGGVPPWLASEMKNVYGRGYYRSGRGAQVTSTVADLLGQRPRSFDDFVQAYADQFRS